MKTIKLFALLVALAFIYACGGGDSGNNSTPGPAPVPAGTATLVSSGGTGGTGTGGNGGSINFDIYGDVSVTSSGSVDTSFTIPAYTSNYGVNKWTVSAPTTVKLVGTDTINAGDYYLYPSTSTLYYLDGASETTVTGLEVQAGTTLTLPANYGTYTSISVNNSVTINGTVKTGETIALYIYTGPNSLLEIGTTGLVTTAATTLHYPGATIYLNSEGVIINRGTIDASGAATTETATSGGQAGYIYLYAYTFIYNTGTIKAKGGASTDGAGGYGNYVYLFSYYSSVLNSGTIDTSGGSGATSGGYGGYVYLYGGWEYSSLSPAVGSVIISGYLVTSGGQGGSSSGGYGGDIYIVSYGGKIWSNATITAKGGSSTGTDGGYGGSIDLNGYYGYDYGNDNNVASQGIKLSGAIDLSGGSGYINGGQGGSISFENNTPNAFNQAVLLPSPAAEMVGFASLTMDGGAGYNGGNGGNYTISTSVYLFGVPNRRNEVPVGSIINQVPVSAKGGAADLTNGYGGNGGSINFDWMNSGDDAYTLVTTITTSNSGAINISGGAGCYGSGYGYGSAGSVYMFGYGKLTNSGAITARGGAGTYSGGNGSLNSIDLYSSYDIENTGAIDVSGGNSSNYGGVGGVVNIYAGGQTRNSSAINAAGGAGDLVGGNGGTIDLFSENGPTSNSGSLSAMWGLGASYGNYGMIFIDWVDVTPAHTSPI